MDLLDQNVALLDQGSELLARLDPELFGPDSDGSGVGAHLRHCLDFYRCLLAGLDGEGEGDGGGDRPGGGDSPGAGELGRVDYDVRERVAEVETELATAAAVLDELRAALAGLRGKALERPLLVRVDDAVGRGADGGWQRSTFGRELQFLISHTIHHYAIIAMLLRGRGFEPGDELGVAPSTLAHRRRSAACAR